MDIQIRASIPHGSVTPPSSKSISHRALIAASLSRGQSTISSILLSDDTNQTIEALRVLGVDIDLDGTTAAIDSKGVLEATGDSINVGESGTTARLMIALATLADQPITIDGTDRLRERPMKDLCLALEQQGISIEYKDTQYALPCTVHPGRLKGGLIEISGTTSSQFISAILFIAPLAESDVQIKVTDRLESSEYVDLTIDSLSEHGVIVEKKGNNEFHVVSGQKYKAIDTTIEADYSAASYFALLGAINSVVTIEILKKDSHQPDRVFIDFLQKLGADVQQEGGGVTIAPGELHSGSFDISGCPDIAPTLAMCGAFTNDYLELTGTRRLTEKESNRQHAIVTNLRSLGARVEEDENSIRIYRSKLKYGTVDSMGDHRIAMSFAILGTMIDGGLIIENAGVVAKSYPQFFDDLKGLDIDVQNI